MRPIRTPRELGAAIRRARQDRRLSQTELATKAGVGRQWLSELEGGKSSVELGRVLAVLAVLDLAITLTPTSGGRSPVDLDELLGP